MKKLILTAVAVSLAGISAASAADLRRPAPVTKAPAYVAPVYSWTGPYVGLFGGGAWGDADVSGIGTADVSGALLGGTVGYNWQVGQIVFGIEGDAAWTNADGSVGAASVQTDWLATVRGRLGYAAGNFMPYITGGAAFGNVETTIGALSSDDSEAGWTVGVGLEAAISGPLTAKIEYLYVDLGDVNTVGGSTTDYTTNIVRAGLNYRF